MPTGINARYQRFYWDGAELQLEDSKGSSTNDQFDLALVEPRTLIELVTTVRDRLDEASSWHASVNDYELTETRVSAHASNDYNETSYIVATLDGTVVYDSEDAP